MPAAPSPPGASLVRRARRSTTTINATLGGRGVAATQAASRAARRPGGRSAAQAATQARASYSTTSSPSQPSRKAQRVEQARQQVIRSVTQQKPVKAPKVVTERVREVVTDKRKPVVIAPQQTEPLKTTKKAVRISPEAAAKTLGPKEVKAPKAAQKTPEKPAKPRKKVAVAVPEIVPPKLRKTVAKQGQRLNEALAKTGSPLTGPEYLAKLVQFESGWSPTAENPSSAYGLGQFIDSTAEDFRTRLGVETQDPSRPKQMIKGAAMHASGKHGYGALYSGYNPGYSSTDPIPPVASGKNVTVKVPKKAAKRVAGGDVPPPAKSLTTKDIRNKVLEVIPKEFRSEGRGDKRTPAENAAVGGSATSDHLTGQVSYAADLPANDKLAQGIAKRLGMASHTGTNEVVKDGIRWQLIWQDAGHYDHIHLGARPTTGTDAAYSAPGGTGVSVGVTAGAPATPSTTQPKKRKARKPEGKERMKLLRKIIAQGPVASPELPDVAIPDTPARKVTVSL